MARTAGQQPLSSRPAVHAQRIAGRRGGLGPRGAPESGGAEVAGRPGRIGKGCGAISGGSQLVSGSRCMTSGSRTALAALSPAWLPGFSAGRGWGSGTGSLPTPSDPAGEGALLLWFPVLLSLPLFALAGEVSDLWPPGITWRGWVVTFAPGRVPVPVCPGLGHVGHCDDAQPSILHGP